MFAISIIQKDYEAHKELCLANSGAFSAAKLRFPFFWDDAVSIGNRIPDFRSSAVFSSSRLSTLKCEETTLPRTSMSDYPLTQRHFPEERNPRSSLGSPVLLTSPSSCRSIREV